MKTLTEKQSELAKQILESNPDQDVVFVIADGAHMYFDKSNALACAKEENIIPVYASEEAKARYGQLLKSEEEKAAEAVKAEMDAKAEAEAKAAELKAFEEEQAAKRAEEAARQAEEDAARQAEEEAARQAPEEEQAAPDTLVTDEAPVEQKEEKPKKAGNKK